MHVVSMLRSNILVNLACRKLSIVRRSFHSQAAFLCSAPGNVPNRGGSFPEKDIFSAPNLAYVANLCAQEPKQITVSYSNPKSWFSKISDDRVTKLTVADCKLNRNSDSTNVELLILPRGPFQTPLAWPTFLQSKHTAGLGCNIILAKTAPFDTVTYTDDGSVCRSPGEPIVDVLLRGKSNVALMSNPGVGTSTEMSTLMLPLFQALLKNNPLKDVFHRANSQLYRYQVKDGQINCKHIPGAGESMESLQKYFDSNSVRRRKPDRSGAVLVLEMSEGESEPTLPNIPTLMTLPTLGGLERVKALDKSGLMTYAIRPPHTEIELQVLTTALYYGGHSAALSANMGLAADASLQDVLNEMKRRIHMIGPLAKQVLGDCDGYLRWLEEMRAVANPAEFLPHLNSTFVHYAGEESKYFLAAQSNGKMEALSSTAKDLMFRAAKAVHIAEMQRTAPEGHLAEAVFQQYYLRNDKMIASGGNDVPAVWNHRNWEYYRNPELGGVVKRQHRLDKAEADALRSEHTKHQFTACFRSSILHRTIQEFHPEWVYVSSPIEEALGIAVTADKEHERLTLYQSKPSISPKALREWKDASRAKKLCVVYYANWADRRTKSVKVGEFKDDDAVSVELFGEAGRFASFVIRYGVQSSDVPVMLANDDPVYSELLRSYALMVKEGQEDKFQDSLLNQYSKPDLLALGAERGLKATNRIAKEKMVELLMGALRQDAISGAWP